MWVDNENVFIVKGLNNSFDFIAALKKMIIDITESKNLLPLQGPHKFKEHPLNWGET